MPWSCGGLLDLDDPNLQSKSTSNAENFRRKLSWSIWDFDAIHSWNVLQPKIAKNSQTHFGSSRSSMLVPPENSSAVLVMVSSKSVSICNCFHVRRVDNGKIAISTPLWRPRSRGISSLSGMKFVYKKLETLRYNMVKTRSLSPGLESVPGCDGRTELW